MSSIAELATLSSKPIRAYAERLLQGINPSDFAKKPECGGRIIDTNHPAFVYGHLSLYPWRISKLLDLNLTEFEPTPDYFELFSMNAKCTHDPEGKIYPPMKFITEFFFNGFDKVLEVMPQVPDEKLTAVSDDERSKARFPIVGSFIIYLLTAHPNGHLGQVSVWRRCMDLGPA